MIKYNSLRLFNDLTWEFSQDGIKFFCNEELHICSKEADKINVTTEGWEIDAPVGKVVCAYETAGTYYDILITPMGPLELSFLRLDPDNYNLPDWGRYNYPDGSQKEICVDDLTTPEYIKLWEDAYTKISFGDTLVQFKVFS